MKIVQQSGTTRSSWHYAELEDFSGVGFWQIDTDTDMVSASPEYFRILGLKPTTTPLPMSVVREMRVEEDRDRVYQQYRRALGGGDESFGAEFRVRRRDSSVRWILGRGRMFRGPDGRIVRYCGIDIDITARREAELALEDSELRLRLAIEAAGLGIWDWDLVSNTMTWSERAKTIAGFAIDRPVTFEQVRDVTHPEDLPITSGMAKTALDPTIRSKVPFEYRIVRPGGELRWVMAHGEATFRSVEGVEKAIRFTGTIQDISERKNADDLLAESEARLRLALDAARLGIWQYDVAAGQLATSPELNRLLGYPDTAALTLEELRRRYYPGDEEAVRQAGERALANGERYFQCEYRFMHAAGNWRWLHLRAELTTVAGKPSRVAGVVMDITDLKAAEQERQLLHAEMRHRMKNLFAIVGAISAQTFAGDRFEAARSAFVGRLTALANAQDQLSGAAKTDALMDEVVQSALTPHRPGRGAFSIEGPIIRLSSRRVVALSLALNELATNAAKYGALSNQVGQIQIAWTVEDREPKRLVFRWREEGGPTPRKSVKKGFGSRLIQHNLAIEFGGEVTVDLLPTGLQCRLSAPLDDT